MIQPDARPPIAKKIKKAFVIAVTVALLVLSACGTAPQVDAIQTPVEATAASTQVSATLEATATVAPTPTETPAPRINNAEAYYEQFKDQNIAFKQIEVEGKKYSIVTRDNEVLLAFNQNDQLENVGPDDWDSDSNLQWVNVDSLVDLYEAENGEAYVAKIDADGNVTAFLNPMGATLGNLNQQWIEVIDGQPNALWDGKEWITDISRLGVMSRPNVENVYGLSMEEITSLPTTLTFADLNNPNLGPVMLAWERTNNKPSALILIGRLAGTDTTVREIYNVGDTADIEDWGQMIIDIPFSGGYVRASTWLDPGRIKAANINPTETIIFMADELRKLGINPLEQGSYEQALDIIPNDMMVDYQNQKPEELIAEFINNPDYVGSLVGVVIPPERQDGSPNPVYKYLLGEGPTPSGSDWWGYDVWRVLLPEVVLK